MGISLRRRFRILKRDSFRCRYCGAAASEGVELHVDHVQPRALGGPDDDRNLVTACVDCNRGKHASPPAWEICCDFLWDWRINDNMLMNPGESTEHFRGMDLHQIWLAAHGEVTAETRDAFRAWIRSDPERKRLLAFWGPDGVGNERCAPESAR